MLISPKVFPNDTRLENIKVEKYLVYHSHSLDIKIRTQGFIMEPVSRELKHVDMIHQTPLIYGVCAYVSDDQPGDHYHIQMICNYLAKEFWEHKTVKDFTPLHPDPLSNLPITKIKLDTDFVQFARVELEEHNEEELVPEGLITQGPIGELTHKLFMEYHENEANRQPLTMDKMKEIAKDFFEENVKTKQEIGNDQAPAYKEGSCLDDFDWDLGLAFAAVACVVLALFSIISSIFSGDSDQKKSGTTSIVKNDLSEKIRYGGSIY